MGLSKSSWSTTACVCRMRNHKEQAPAREIPQFLRHIRTGDGAWREQEPSVSPQILQVSELQGPQQERADPVFLPVPVPIFDGPRAVPDPPFAESAQSLVPAGSPLFWSSSGCFFGDSPRQDTHSQCHLLSWPAESRGYPKIQRACKLGKLLAVLACSLQRAASPSCLL